MNMRDNNFLQKLKDNVFYVALGLGMVAVLAVVAVYTVQRNQRDLASNEMDLNQASDFVLDNDIPVSDVDGSITRTDSWEDSAAITKMPEEEPNMDIAVKDDEGKAEQLTEKEEEPDEEASKEVPEKKEEVPKTDEPEQKVSVTADTGELNFTSDKTIGWPVQGKVLIPYSMETTVYFQTLDQYQCSPAMMIAAGRGTTVKSAYLGQVTDITSDNIYGNLVTVYLGNDYSVVYGQLDTIYVNEGDFVKAGDSIGTVGTPTGSFEKEGSHLYFKMMKKEQPVDPALFME